MKITVLGAGAWGTALAELLADNGHEVNLWFFDKVSCTETKKKGVNPYLPGLKLNKEIILITDLQLALEKTEVVVLATPAQFTRSILGQIKPFLNSKMMFVVCAKGIETKNFCLLSEVIKKELPAFSNRTVYLSGPSFADEVAAGRETAVVIAGPKTIVKRVQPLFASQYFRPYASEDIVGVEIAGAYKNVLAIGAGVLAGLGKGQNLQAALIARGLKEMMILGKKMGASEKTFLGLAGVGDLVLTCHSSKSRNYTFGLAVGQGKKASELIKRQAAVVEGYFTVKALQGVMKEKKLKLNIANELYNILFKNKNPEKAIRDLMTRKLKEEF